MRFYLIGMPASGKSTLGLELSKRLGYEFIDMDHYIEKEAFMFVDEIFEAYGEKFFRDLETNTLKELMKLDNVVIATGGGIVLNKANKRLMDGKVIYLDVSILDLNKRVEESSIVRPVLESKPINALYLERKELYEYFADITVYNSDMNEAIESILKSL